MGKNKKGHRNGKTLGPIEEGFNRLFGEKVGGNWSWQLRDALFDRTEGLEPLI
jgi:hypothetical protein